MTTIDGAHMLREPDDITCGEMDEQACGPWLSMAPEAFGTSPEMIQAGLFPVDSQNRIGGDLFGDDLP